MAVVAVDRFTGETQRGAYSLLLVLSGVALGVSGLPAPLYGMYEEQWHLSPLATTIVFAVYAVAALGAVLVSGRISDVVGRKPVLLGALVAMIVGLGVFLVADNMAMLMLARWASSVPHSSSSAHNSSTRRSRVGSDRAANTRARASRSSSGMGTFYRDQIVK